jgi:putative Mn2+ efflux pump MntP
MTPKTRRRLLRLRDFLLIVVATVSTILAVLTVATVARSNFIRSQFGATAPWWIAGFIVLAVGCGIVYTFTEPSCHSEPDHRIKDR